MEAISFNCPHCKTAMNQLQPPNYQVLPLPSGAEWMVVAVFCSNLKCQAIIGSYSSPSRCRRGEALESSSPGSRSG